MVFLLSEKKEYARCLLPKESFRMPANSINVTAQSLETGTTDGTPVEERIVLLAVEMMPILLCHLQQCRRGLESRLGSGLGKTIPRAGFLTTVTAIDAIAHTSGKVR